MSASNQVVLVLIGGMHPASFSTELGLAAAADPILGQIPVLIFPAQPTGTVLSAHALRTWLEERLSSLGMAGTWQSPTDIIIWAFSAGCVGAAGLAHHWQQHRGQLLALFAVDGWGVPLSTTAYPTYRLSHDLFTHISSGWLGSGPVNFYAEPSISHLDLWCHPLRARGWQTVSKRTAPRDTRQPMTAADFLCHWSRHHLQQRQ